MPNLDRHIFVCINERAADSPRGCYHSKGGDDVRLALREKMKEAGLLDRMRVNKSGCLDACEFGVAVAVYPDNIWYKGVTAEDAESIVQEHIIGGTPVERLLITKES